MEKTGNTRDHILSVAALHFSDYGFEGTRMDKIARDAKVNKASIYYNIGNKEALYAMVLNNVIEKSIVSFLNAFESDWTAEKKLEGYIRHIASTIKNNPVMPKIIMREQLSQGEHLPESFAGNISQMLDMLGSILEQGCEEGAFNVVDTLTIHFMIFGTILFHITTSPIREKKESLSTKYQPEPGLLPQSIVDKIVEYILRAVKKEK
jgi:AcrR family transcriptional regulator